MHAVSSKKAQARAARTGALALGVLWIAWQAFGVVHLLTVPHVFCPEHGELIDAEESSGSAPYRDVGRRDRAFVEQDASKPRGPHAHEHCLFTVTARRQAAWIVSPHDAVVVTFVATHPEVVFETPRESLLQLFRLAPKQSPPV